jgi:capsular polysaccharide export protein
MRDLLPATTPADQRRFLMLQGPHGPFFDLLAGMLRAAGAEVWRVGFNRGDEAFWSDPARFIPFREPAEAWPDACAAILHDRGITDLVLYGDTRPIHAIAARLAREAGILVHVFEEGYIRPYWITYERGGSNGNSRLMSMSIAEMRAALSWAASDPPSAPARWGEMRQHVWYGAIYHWFVLARNGGYPNFRPHRAASVMREFVLYLRRLLLMPVHSVGRFLAQRRIRNGGFPYHLALLQLDHDASFRDHSSFDSIADFIELCCAAFAIGAPRHHHLVFKSHPLEDDRVALGRVIAEATARHGLGGRVHFVRSGKLAALLNDARSAVTVNSTAAQQVLWRGLPLKTLGRAVYGKPELVSNQPLIEFFRNPRRPDTNAYRDFRHYLIETSQIAGGFYSARGRRMLLRQVIDILLAAEDPYDALRMGTAAPRHKLRVLG